MAIRRMVVRPGQQPTAEQRARIKQAAARPIVYDEDAPELTDDELARFAVLAAEQRAEREKQTVSLKLAPSTVAKAKQLGRGYTEVLSRLLTMALDNPEMVRRCM